MALFTLPTDFQLPTTDGQRYTANLQAMRVVRELEASGKEPTPEQRIQLARYVGWGISGVLKMAQVCQTEYGYTRYLPEPNPDIRACLSDNQTDQEWNAILNSAINAHYTSLPIIRAIWEGVARILPGKGSLKVLEPACGVGHFIGGAPLPIRERISQLVMVELETFTARIARLLYPEAQIENCGFEQIFRLPRGERTLKGYFDICISNVPFGKVMVSDPGMKPVAATKNLHNYFISRMLELTRPGGYTVVITSRYTLDGITTAQQCRRAWADVADLELALRLPDSAFRTNAGTDVITDILFLRKRNLGEPSVSRDWIASNSRGISGTKKECAYFHRETGEKAGAHMWGDRAYVWEERPVPYEQPIYLNDYWKVHPDHILGVETLSGKMFSKSTNSWGDKIQTPDGALMDEKLLDKSYWNIKSKKERQEYERAQREQTARAQYNVEALSEDQLGSLSEQIRAKLSVLQRTDPDTYTVRAQEQSLTLRPDQARWTPTTEIQKAWEKVYIQAKNVIKAQVDRCSDEELADLQSELLTVYKEAKTTSKGGILSPAVRKEFSVFPAIYAFLCALETKSGEPEALFFRRTIYPQQSGHATCTDPAEACFLCLDHLGRIDIPWIAQICRLSEQETIAQLGARIYQDPETETWVMSEEYLSGPVRAKLHLAKRYASMDPDRYARNVTALEQVQPTDIPATEIFLSLKSSWIPDSVMQSFLSYLLKGDTVYGYKIWTEGLRRLCYLSDALYAYHSDIFDAYSSSRVSMASILQHGLDGSEPVVMDTIDDGDKKKFVRNNEETVLASLKLEALQTTFRSWIWQDTERTEYLSALYNDKFNGFRTRKWDGSFLTFPGLNTSYTLRPWQRDGVARGLFWDRVSHPALIWPTGAGKTFAAICLAEKRLQLGISRKVCICVPKNLIPQWMDDYIKLFPSRADSILCAGGDSLSAKERGTFLSRAATGGYQVIILSHTQLKAIPIRKETFEVISSLMCAQLSQAIELEENENGSEGRQNQTLKRLRAQMMSLTAKIKDLEERTAKDSDQTITWEELGFDFFIGDEAQAWKNLAIVSRMGSVAGIRSKSSQIAQDFFCKIRHLQMQGGLTLLTTATPIANSLAESYVFAQYTQWELLKKLDLETADAFFAVYTKNYTSSELDPACAKYRQIQRLEFGNIPELAYTLRESWNIITEKDLTLKIPRLATGEEILCQVPASRNLSSYIEEIGRRAERIKKGKVQPEIDNMLKVCSDGRWASIVNGDPSDQTEIRDTKLDLVVRNTIARYQESASFLGTQVIFCDLGTPTGESSVTPKKEEEEISSDSEEYLGEREAIAQTRVYEYLRQQLIVQGRIPAQEIAFLQDYQRDPVKARKLYADINAGRIRILLGSAPTGMNIQERLYALHHVDPVWRPDWKTQRDGRILRQGNTCEEVYIYIYLTEGSFDAYMWGLVRAKLRVIDQIMAGDATIRKLDGDVGEIVLRASEIQAIASGNPDVLQLVGIQSDLTKLAALRNEFDNKTRKALWDQEKSPALISEYEEKIHALTQDLELLSRHPSMTSTEDAFRIQLQGRILTDKTKARDELVRIFAGNPDPRKSVGEYRGFRIYPEEYPTKDQIEYQLVGFGSGYWVRVTGPNQTWVAWDQALQGIEHGLESRKNTVARLRQELVQGKAQLQKTFLEGMAYTRLWYRHEILSRKLMGSGVTASDFRRPEEGWLDNLAAEKGMSREELNKVLRGEGAEPEREAKPEPPPEEDAFGQFTLFGILKP